jgi:16S rRNA (uracil1498-N3)-methyltransferase
MRPIIAHVVRRIHVREVRVGEVTLDTSEAHHIRDVLRLDAGSVVELFDSAGRVADGVLTHIDSDSVRVTVQQLRDAPANVPTLIVAAAVPKGDRADWMIEKLSELGVSRFIPLATARSVVLPGGKNKTERWQRIAIESAKQSRRAGVMEIAELTPLNDAVRQIKSGWYLSTGPDTQSIHDMLRSHSSSMPLVLFIGPEGGWTDEEMKLFDIAGFTAVGLTATILRIETAAIAAAAVVACWRS